MHVIPESNTKHLKLQLNNSLHTKAWNVGQFAQRIVCYWMSPHYTDSGKGACWVFDRQLMVHEALGRDISENPQVSLPLFPSPPLAAPIKL